MYNHSASNPKLALLCLLLVGSYAHFDFIEATRLSNPIRHSISHPNGFFPTGVVFRQPGVAFTVQSVRTDLHPVLVQSKLSDPLPVKLISAYNQRVVSPQLPISDQAVPTPSSQPELNVTSHCAQLDTATDKQFQAYLSGIEALTGTIQELDEAVQQLKPTLKSCEELVTVPSTASSTLRSSSREYVTDDSTLTTTTETPFYDPTVATTTESFTDSPIVTFRRGRDVNNESQHFGMPNAPANPPVIQDQAGEDLAKASSDLRSLRKDLANSAEWLKQTNYTVHSVMLRALQAYVTSIERRVEHQRQLYAQARGTGLKLKIGLIKEKVAVLLEKLRALAPFKHAITRDDRGPAADGITTPSIGTLSPTSFISPASTPAPAS